jgi:hypothetical protein
MQASQILARISEVRAKHPTISCPSVWAASSDRKSVTLALVKAGFDFVTLRSNRQGLGGAFERTLLKEATFSVAFPPEGDGKFRYTLYFFLAGAAEQVAAG